MIETTLKWFTPAEQQPGDGAEILVVMEEGGDKERLTYYTLHGRFYTNKGHPVFQEFFCENLISWKNAIYWAYAPTKEQIEQMESLIKQYNKDMMK
jgi:hypothetical protein